MRDVRLRLEHGAHERGQPRVEVEHLLELVEDERDAATTLGSQLSRQLEQTLEGGVHVLPRDAFARFIRERFAATGKAIEPWVVERVLDMTGGHPYGTQELCYEIWEETAADAPAGETQLAAGLSRVLRSENAHFTRIWDTVSRTQRLVLQALATEPTRAVTASEYRYRHGLPVSSSVQRALDALAAAELVVKERPGAYRIAEPFLAEWILRYGS